MATLSWVCRTLSPAPVLSGPMSVTERGRVLVDPGARLRGAEVEMLEDRVAVGPGPRGVDDGLGELLARQSQVPRQPRQAVLAQAAVDLGAADLVIAQERREEGPDTRQLAVVAGLGEQLLDRVQDLVIATTARAAGARCGHRHAGEHKCLGERRQEQVGL